MRLRTKIIATVAAVMILSLLIMSLAVLKLSLDYERVRRDEIRQLLRKELVHVYANMDEGVFFDYLRMSTVLGEWYFFRGRDMIASSETGRMTKNRIYTSVKLDSCEPGAKLVFMIKGNRIIHTSHFTFFITWLLCTVLMAGILYLTLSRLVIKPIDIVVKAGRQASRGIKPGINPLPGRTDEAGLMVREFYGLLEEIYEYRTHLEKKVSQVSEEVRRTHEKLIVSQRLSATGKLAAGIAHEINNPLGGMLNTVSALKKPGSAEKRKE